MIQSDVDKRRLAQLQKLFRSSTEDKLIGALNRVATQKYWYISLFNFICGLIAGSAIYATVMHFI